MTPRRGGRRTVARRGAIGIGAALWPLVFALALGGALLASVRPGAAAAPAADKWAATTVPAAPTALTNPAPAPSTNIYAKPVSSRLNTTGKAINMPVPFKDEGQALGEVIIRINPDDTVLIPKAGLVDKLTPILDKAALARLHGLADTNGQLSISTLKAAGFDISFDPGQMELRFAPNADQRPLGELSLARRSLAPQISANAAKPAIFSGYLNVIAGVDHLWGTSSIEERTAARVDFESVLRFWSIVVENEFTFEGEVDPNTCPVSAMCVYDHAGGFKRRRSRAVYDMPEQQLRIQVGDADSFATGFQRSPDILGVSLEKSPRKLNPGENMRPTGRSSFRIERPSEIEVVINGAIVQRLRLRAGNYNLSDLPLSVGANEVQLIITDDTGERRTLAFTTFFDGTLLAKGKSEWSLAGGLPSTFSDNERDYITDDYFATGFYRYGLTDQVTAEGHMQGDSHVIMGGLGIFTVTPWGIFGLQNGISTSDSGMGFVAKMNYDLTNFRGPVSYFTDKRDSLRLGAEYRSTDFRTPGEFQTTASGILFPQYNYWLRLSAAYSAPLFNNMSATLGARYQFADDQQLVLSPYTLKGDRYGVDLTLASPITTDTTGSITIGYSNESYLFADTTSNDQADLRVMARLFWRPTENVRVSSSFNSLNKEGYTTAYYEAGRGLDRWDASVDLQYNGRDENLTAGAAVGHYGNRFEARVAQTSGFHDLSADNLKLAPAEQRTSARVGTALAFADGRFGMSQPIRGNGFAILYPHKSIAGRTVTVGEKEDVRARSDWLGPAVVANIPAYTTSTIPIDVADLPVGYSLGVGAIETHAPYRAGYALEIGSAYSVSAYGTLLLANGEPVSLLTGVAFPIDKPDKQVTIFTNASGRFGAEGLAPGKWVIEMATEGSPTRYEIVVPSGTEGLFRAGELKPVGRS